MPERCSASCVLWAQRRLRRVSADVLLWRAVCLLGAAAALCEVGRPGPAVGRSGTAGASACGAGSVAVGRGLVLLLFLLLFAVGLLFFCTFLYFRLFIWSNTEHYNFQ